MVLLLCLMKGNLYHTPGGANALLEHICTSLHGLLHIYGAIWAHMECISALPWQLGFGFYRCPAKQCKMVLTWYHAPQLRKPPWISEATETSVFDPTMFVFFGSLSLTNQLLYLLEIRNTFLTNLEVLCSMEPLKEVTVGAFLEQTSFTRHHNLQTKVNHWLQIAVGIVTCVICIRPSLNNRQEANEYNRGLALIRFDLRSAQKKNPHQQNSLSSSVQLLLSFVFNNMVFAHSQTSRLQGCSDPRLICSDTWLSQSDH